MRGADRWAISDLMHRYARSVDRRDWDGVRGCYHPDAIDDHGGYRGDREGLIAWMVERHARIVLSMHFLTNVLVEFTEPDSAVVETYSITVQRTPAADAVQSLRMYSIPGLDRVSADSTVETRVRCRFVDVVTRRGGDWRVWRRTVVYESMDYTVLTPTDFGPSFATGSRTGTDPLWRIRAESSSRLGTRNQVIP
ncbi:nuclear transport factor 2 family protein [Actinophytocola sp.]|uniref:nuclear transport factor 2 family protein n=1 Tax=Actinophytocola sp. TaxID=1872138 RepID=UPI003D6C3080